MMFIRNDTNIERASANEMQTNELCKKLTIRLVDKQDQRQVSPECIMAGLYQNQSDLHNEASIDTVQNSLSVKM